MQSVFQDKCAAIPRPGVPRATPAAPAQPSHPPHPPLWAVLFTVTRHMGSQTLAGAPDPARLASAARTATAFPDSARYPGRERPAARLLHGVAFRLPRYSAELGAAAAQFPTSEKDPAAPLQDRPRPAGPSAFSAELNSPTLFWRPTARGSTLSRAQSLLRPREHAMADLCHARDDTHRCGGLRLVLEERPAEERPHVRCRSPPGQPFPARGPENQASHQVVPLIQYV